VTATENDSPTNEPDAEAPSLGQKRRGVFLALGIGAGALALVIVALMLASNRGVTQVATMDQMVVPEGWTTVVAPSGDFAFATPSEWKVTLNYDEQALNLPLYPGPSVRRELVGLWYSTDDAIGASLYVRVIGVTGTEVRADLRTEVEGAALNTPRDVELGVRTVVRNEGFRHPLGFAGQYVETCGPDHNGSLCRAAIGVSNGQTVVVVVLENRGNAEFGLDDLKDVARSIVILHAVQDIQDT
jgi:hypothetical protein